MNIHEYIETSEIEMGSPRGSVRADLFWNEGNNEIRPDLVGEKEIHQGQNVAIGIFNALGRFIMIVSISESETYIYKEENDIDLLNTESIPVLPR